MIFEIRRFESVTSTNDLAAEYARNGAKEGTVILADSQTAGRGRMGRKFFSPEKNGIYMSLVLRPRFSAENALLITTAAAVAVAKTVEKHTAKKALVKWVNDIYINEKKVCGILTEGKTDSSGGLEYAILGIGVNLKKPRGGFDKSIESIAGALFEDGEYDVEQIALDILEAFDGYYKNILEKPHFEEYASRNMLLGKKVDIIRAGECVGEGMAGEIAEDFSLYIRTANGKIKLSTGEVSVKASE